MLINSLKTETKCEKDNYKYETNKDVAINEIISYLISNYSDYLSDISINKRTVENIVREKVYKEYSNMNTESTIRNILDRLFGYYILQKYIDNKEVSDIRVTRFDNIMIKKKGVWEKVADRFTSEEEFINFVKKNNSFVLKPVDGHGGVGIRFLSLSDYKSALELYDSVKEFSPFVVEEIVNQSLDMASFHPESLNTVRVVTFHNYGHMSIVWAFLRVGQGDSNVDNMTSGGLGALVDNETGIVISDAIDYKGSKVVSHPDSNVVFKGFKIPDWEGLKSILAKLSAKVPSAHCIGWDMAHTDKGWVLIEGNGRAQVVTIQVLNDKGYKPLFEKMAYLCNVDCGDENDEEE